MNRQQRKQNERNWQKTSTGRRNFLMGKVVLLIGDDMGILQTLVTQLAQKGADIALVCKDMPSETAHKIKDSVQAFGRHLLVIEQAKRKTATVAQLIETVTFELGQLDIFIDISAPKSNLVTEKGGHMPLWSQPNWQFTKAILMEMTHT